MIKHPFYGFLYWDEESQQVFSDLSGKLKPRKSSHGGFEFKYRGKNKVYKLARFAWECYNQEETDGRIVTIIDKKQSITPDNIRITGEKDVFEDVDRLDGTAHHAFKDKWLSVAFVDGCYTILGEYDTEQQAHKRYLKFTGQI